MKQPAYQYKAFCESVYDGDTATFMVDLGFKTMRREKMRFYGIDTPEIRTKNKKEKKYGLGVRDFVRDAIELKDVLIETTKQGKFGRYPAKIYYKPLAIEDKWICLNNELLKLGYAKEYYGGKR